MKANVLFLFFIMSTLCHGQTVEGTWTGELDMKVQKLRLVFHFAKTTTGEMSCKMDSPDQGAKGIPTVINYVSADSVSVAIPQIAMTYTGKKKNDEIKGTFTQMGMSMPLILKRGAIERKRPQYPVAPYPYSTEEVSIKAGGDVVLAGTLIYPTDYQSGKKVPVVLMITGSGMQNRDEEIFEHKPFLVIADYLARNGIATLRCDDRGHGASKGDASRATTVDFAMDASACVAFLKEKNDFSHIGVMGHSEGASIAFMLGAECKADFVVSIAGIGVRGDEALTAQVNKISQLMGVTTVTTTEQYRNNALRANNPWLNYFIDYDPSQHIKLTKCPVFAMNGGKDVQVISSQNLSAIQRLLPSNKYNIIKEYPSLNHLMQTATTGLVSEYADIEETFSPQVLVDIVEWINKVKGKN